MPATSGTMPFSPFEWLMATRYLRPRRKQGFISVIAIFSFLGIMLGVMTLIVVMAVMNGFRQELYTKLLGLNGHMLVSKFGDPFTDFDETAARIKTAPHVTLVIPFLYGQALTSTAGAVEFSRGVEVRGMRAADIESSLKLVNGQLVVGTLEGFDSSSDVVIGQELGKRLGVTVGSQIKLVTSRGKSTIFGQKPNAKVFAVAAVFKVGMEAYDMGNVFMPFSESQAFFNYPSQAHYLEVMVDEPERVKQLTPAVRDALGPGYVVSDWEESNKTFFTVLDVERDVMFFILSLIIVVATLNVISGLMMLVKDKGRDIAILRTMGATPGSVMRIFLITGASIGVVGTFAGFLLGVVMCHYIEEIREFISWVTGKVIFDPNVYLIAKLEARMNPYETASIVIVSFLLAVAATLYPSWRASRLDPVEALRYE